MIKTITLSVLAISLLLVSIVEIAERPDMEYYPSLTKYYFTLTPSHLNAQSYKVKLLCLRKV